MSLESEMKARFGGILNSLLLLLLIIISLRFSSIEMADQPLDERLLCTVHLLLGCFAVGFILGILRIFLSFTNKTYTRAPASANFASGMKYGIMASGLLILIVGMVQLENFLGPLQPMLDAIIGFFNSLLS